MSEDWRKAKKCPVCDENLLGIGSIELVHEIRDYGHLDPAATEDDDPSSVFVEDDRQGTIWYKCIKCDAILDTSEVH
jgi:hypothetical protein